MLTKTRFFLMVSLAGTAAGLVTAACGSNNGGTSGFGDAGAGASSGTGASSGSSGGTSSGSSSGIPVLGGSSSSSSGGASPVDAGEIAVVYAQSADTLYKLDPNTKAVTTVGAFSGCTSVIDIAIDQNSNGYVTTSNALYKVNLATAACTHIADGSYPNSLSFVPKGTLDPSVEALVGYVGAQYIRIDTGTGAITNVGNLTGGYQSSGDIVSIIGGGTFLTVNGNGCGDCLLQVDPKTGDLVQNYGSVGHSSVFGLAFWGGTAYGFDDAGDVFSIDVVSGAVVTHDIPVPSAPANLSFWGAGSTTSAPATAADGGGIPIQVPK
jgi:hypothetical protein